MRELGKKIGRFAIVWLSVAAIGVSIIVLLAACDADIVAVGCIEPDSIVAYEPTVDSITARIVVYKTPCK